MMFELYHLLIIIKKNVIEVFLNTQGTMNTIVVIKMHILPFKEGSST